MSKRRLHPPTFTTPASTLQQFLRTADLSTVVPLLPDRALQRLVAVIGLESAGEVLVSATPRQFLRAIDADLWANSGGARGASFDADRFGHWLQVLVEADVDAAARQLQALDQELFAAAMARHVGVCSRDTADRRGLLDSAQTWECGGLIVWARREEAWDAIATLLAHLQLQYHEWLATLLKTWRELSYEYLEEASGFDDLLNRREQSLHDIDVAHDERREAQGYVTAASARAFLASARQPSAVTGIERDAEVRAYFRHVADPPPADAGDAGPDRAQTTTPQVESDADALIALIEHCEVASPIRGRLGAGGRESGAPASRVAAMLAHLASRDPAALDIWHLELGFLANCLLASGVLPEQRSAEADAVAAATATCDLGLEQCGADVSSHELMPVAAFRVGWLTLHREVSMFAAEGVLRTLGQIQFEHSDTHEDVRRLRRALREALARERPWEARACLDVLATFDLPTWSTLMGLLAEHPVVPQGCLEPRTRRLRHTTMVEFISSLQHLAWVRTFVTSLTHSLESGA